VRSGVETERVSISLFMKMGLTVVYFILKVVEINMGEENTSGGFGNF
jgi:hypothetical protein